MRIFTAWLIAFLSWHGTAGAQQEERISDSTDWLRSMAGSGTTEGHLMLLDQAMHGSAEAQYDVALLFRGGAPILQDIDSTRYWFQKAASQGHRASLEGLRLLASEGDSGAFYSLGILSRDGVGVPRDAEAARKAFRLSAEGGHVLALFAEADMLMTGEGGALDRTAALVRYGRANGLVRAELKLSTEEVGGEPRGGAARAITQYWIGKLYLIGGTGVRRNSSKAAAWFADAANSGVDKAQYELAISYLHGRGVTRDEVAARTWLKRAAEQGMVLTQRELVLLEGL